jgi:hypothetical protein
VISARGLTLLLTNNEKGNFQSRYVTQVARCLHIYTFIKLIIK